MNATYSLQDDKIRIYSGRLDEEDYRLLTLTGYQRAPKQGCFFAVWTPEREDLAIKFCGDISDEDTTLHERAEARSERFEAYSEHASARSEAASQAAHDLVKNIPMGQPILVGHHSEAHHRRTLERSDSNMRKAIDERNRSEYWADRAAASLANAEYKERPGVIARRIKKLEADLRMQKRRLKENGSINGFLESVNYAYPQLSKEEALAMAQKNFENYPKRKQRWIDHLNGRLTYERARLAAAGGLPTENKGVKVGDEIRTCFGWWTVLKVNKVTVTAHPHNTKICPWDEKIPFDEIKEVKNKEEILEK